MQVLALFAALIIGVRPKFGSDVIRAAVKLGPIRHNGTEQQTSLTGNRVSFATASNEKLRSVDFRENVNYNRINDNLKDLFTIIQVNLQISFSGSTLMTDSETD